MERAEVVVGRAAVARLRLLRRLRWRSRGREAVALAGALLPGVACVVVFGLVLAAGGPRRMPDDVLVLAGVVLAMFGAIAMLLGAMVVGLSAAGTALVHLLVAPFHLVRAVRAVQRGRLRARAEALLEQEGRIPGAWAAGSPARRRVLEEVSAGDPALRRAPDAGVEAASPLPRPCGTCGAERRPVGEGVWRCDHCAQESFLAPALPARVLEARRRLVGVREGAEPPRTRAELWRAFRAQHGGELAESQRWLTCLLGAYAACAVVGEAGALLGGHAWAVPGLAGIVLLALPVLGLLVATVHAYFRLRFVEFGPGERAFELAVASEVVAVVAEQGRMGRPALARHLEMSLTELDTVLARMVRLGAPVLFDRERDQLVSLSALELSDRRCLACGGELALVPGGRVGCSRCGAPLEAARAK